MGILADLCLEGRRDRVWVSDTSLQALPQRTDTKLYRIQTPQTPIARTAAYDHFHMDEFPNGTNMVVAVLAYTGAALLASRHAMHSALRKADGK